MKLRVLLQLGLLAATFWAAQAANGAAASPDALGEVVFRYGPWGVVALLLSGNLWTQRRLVSTLGRISIAFVRLVDYLADRPCLLEQKPELRQLIKDLRDLNGENGG